MYIRNKIGESQEKSNKNILCVVMSHQVNYLKMSRGEEVRQRICQNHLAYLNQEETPTKLEQRCNLEGLIAEFLSLVPHNQKFSCPKIGDVLHRSIQENPNFSIYKGATAFQALEKYATNLLSHPWRKEYKIVKLYSGYFKHTVDTQLLNAESIFILLGYEKHNEILFFDGPIDPDHVTQVALDCLIAYVECQVMIQICEKITNYKCTWDEVHQVREDYVCGIDEAVRILQQLKRAEMAEEKHSFERQQLKNVSKDYTLSSLNVSQSIPHTGILVDLSNTWPNLSHSDIIPPPPSLPPSQFDGVSHPTKQKAERTAVSHLRSPSWSEGVSLQLDRQRQVRRKGSRSDEIDDLWSPVSSWSGPNTIGDPAMDRIDDSLDLYMPIPKSNFQDNSYVSGYTDFDRNAAKMNYSQQSLFKNVYSNPYDFMPHFHSHANFSFMPHPDIFMNNTRQCQCYTCCEQSAMFSHKDKLGNIEAKEKYRKMEKQTSPCVAGAFHQLSLDNYQQLSKPWKMPSDKLQKFENHNTAESIIINDDNPVNSDVNNRKMHNTNKRTSFYDNLAHDAELSFTDISTKDDDGVSASHAKNITYKGISEKNPNSRNNIVNKVVSAVELPNNSVLQNTLDSSSVPRKESNSSKWSCSFCTYLNSSDKKICEMCGHSRFTGAESMPLVSGGRECPQCTLVNDKDAKICSACGTSLKDSPTYI